MVIWAIAIIIAFGGLIIQFITDLKNNSENQKDQNFIKDKQDKLKSFSEIRAKQSVKQLSDSSMSYKKVFIVHGRDDLAKSEAARFIEKLKLEAIILHEQANIGKTIIEKIEEYTNVGFAIILYTPCDTGSLKGESDQKSRARQNVVFEHGYLIAKLGRKNVCALVKDDIETPNDISGILYIELDKHGAWKVKVAKELQKAGYVVDMNNIAT